MMAKVNLEDNEVAGTYASIWCVGCKEPHSMPVRGKTGSDPERHRWEFDNNLEEPTFSPSLLCNKPGPYHYAGAPVCHSYIRKGKMQFLNDCTHEFAGQTVDLPDYPEEWT